MSLLGDLDRKLENGPKIMELLQERELEIFSILSPASANRVVTSHNLSELLRNSLDKATFESLSQDKKQRDCFD